MNEPINGSFKKFVEKFIAKCELYTGDFLLDNELSIYEDKKNIQRILTYGDKVTGAVYEIRLRSDFLS